MCLEQPGEDDPDAVERDLDGEDPEHERSGIAATRDPRVDDPATENGGEECEERRERHEDGQAQVSRAEALWCARGSSPRPRWPAMTGIATAARMPPAAIS